MWESEGPPERLRCCVRHKKACNDYGRCNAKPFVREINGFDWFLAHELLDLEWMAIKTVRQTFQEYCPRLLTKNGFKIQAHLRDSVAMFSLSKPAMMIAEAT